MKIYTKDSRQKMEKYIYIYIYKLAKARERKIRNLSLAKCIKYKNQKVLLNERTIKERWKEYFTMLFNEGGETSVGSP